MTPPVRERGAALLTVLLLVAVMAVLSASALERLRLATRLAGNSLALDQARAYAVAAETIAASRIDRLVRSDPARTTLAGDWHGRETRLPVPGGIASVTVTDGGNCFNLNSVVSGSPLAGLQPRPIGIGQFVALMETIGILPGDARAVAASLADWIDSDRIASPGGGEDEAYRDRPIPYRTANTLLADVSELRAVAGVSPDIYARLRPWVCALPVTDLSPINVNTLAPDRAPLFVMLLPDQISLERARQMLAERPAGGYASLVQFWRVPALYGLVPLQEVERQTGMRTRWFALDIAVEIGDAELEERALIDASLQPARLVRRSWGEEG